jgi:exopolyphosphatase/guanosine-5'-triphosphate,3'-diphosphate pyrophosphatase
MEVAGTRPHPRPAQALRLCVIDLGSNSFHALVVDAFPDASFVVRAKRKEMVKLGARGFNTHRLTDAAMNRGAAAMGRIRVLAESWGVSAYLACATSAVREASNGGAFIERVRHETGIEVRTITGDIEARLIYLAVRNAVDLSETSLLVDVGGGSTEFIVAGGNRAHYLASLPLGAQRLTERFVSTDPVSREEFRAMRDHVRTSLRGVLAAARRRGVRRVVGSSGTLVSLASATAASYGDPHLTVFEQTLDALQVRETTRRIMWSSRAERIATPGVSTKRAGQIVAGAVLLDVVLKDLAIERLVVSPASLREGILLDYLARERKWVRRLAPYRSRRREAVYEFGMRLRFERDHAERVAAFVLKLFDATQPLHRRGEEARDLLEFAALLHDVGYAVSRHAHHKHSAYLIQEAGLAGFTPDETALMAIVARYHRFGVPKPEHEAFQRLDAPRRRLALQLAALLRLANGLDRGHLGSVRGLDAVLDREALHLTLHTAGDAALELWAASLGSDLFTSQFGRRVEMTVAGATEGSHERATVRSA